VAKIAASERDAFYEARRTALTEVAVRLWAERGFDATSVAAIADAAGMSKGTFYLYFRSKQALLEDVLRRYTLLPSIRSMVEDLADRSLDEAVHTFVREAWRHLGEHRHLLLLALRELPTHIEQLQEALEHVFVPGNRLIATYLEERLGAERAREISLVIAGRGLIGMVVLLFLSQEVLGIGRFLPVEEEKIPATIAEVFLHGVTGTGAQGTR
jgi:AcrR family transcriptional regulator